MSGSENKQELKLLEVCKGEDEEILYCDICDRPVCVIRYSKKGIVHQETPACKKCGCGVDATGVEETILCMNCRGSTS